MRLHIVICLTWICKGLALFADEKLVIYSNVTYAVQGLVIFVLFVMNRHVLHLVNQRYVEKKTFATIFSFSLFDVEYLKNNITFILKIFSDGNSLLES